MSNYRTMRGEQKAVESSDGNTGKASASTLQNSEDRVTATPTTENKLPPSWKEGLNRKPRPFTKTYSNFELKSSAMYSGKSETNDTRHTTDKGLPNVKSASDLQGQQANVRDKQTVDNGPVEDTPNFKRQTPPIANPAKQFSKTASSGAVSDFGPRRSISTPGKKVPPPVLPRP
jgi:hypothetical protein